MERYKQILQTYESAFRIIRKVEKIATEAGIEELCKVLLLKLCFEHKNNMLLEFINAQLKETSESAVSVYRRIFETYVPLRQFNGWEATKLSKECLMMVITELSEVELDIVDAETSGEALTTFLQRHYTGYLAQYSTPKVLTEYVAGIVSELGVYSVSDPCCGLGGFLVEMAKRKPDWLQISGQDINESVANIAKLHLMMYGQTPEKVEQQDSTIPGTGRLFDAVITHVPSDMHEDELVTRVIDMLAPNGVAAIVVSDALLLAEHKKWIRRHIYDNTQILNITRMEGVAYEGSTIRRNFNILFLRKTFGPSDDKSTVTLIRADRGGEELVAASEWVLDVLRGYGSQNDNEQCKHFYLSDMKNWNVQLQFLYDQVGRKYPIVPFGDVVRRSNARMELMPDEIYTLLTVRSKGDGVEVRSNEMGVNVKPRDMFAARPGQLILSTLEAANGAIGIVPRNLKNAIVSRNFMLFDIDRSRIDPNYLWLVMCSNPVQNQLKNLNSRSYAMARISFVSLSAVVIPLPPLDVQREMVKPLLRSYWRIRSERERLEGRRTEFEDTIFG